MRETLMSIHDYSSRSIRIERRHVFVIILSILFSATTIVLLDQPTYAQNPSPDSHFYAVKTSEYTPDSHRGVVVQGLGLPGSGNCPGTTLAGLEAETVNYINNHLPVFSEISPQDYCHSVSGYKNIISDVVNYVAANTNSSDEETYWDGIMVDEEPAFGFSVSQLEDLNQYVSNTMGQVPGYPFWATENFVPAGSHPDGCAWTEATWDAVTGNSIPAPQIVTNCMVTLANHNATDGILVTWSTSYACPWCTESYSTGKIHGAPFYHPVNGHSYWSNRWAPT
ncbi:MAG TPA: hypothetical protein VFJ19_19715 [Nocardioidaceae bacterium]|nr:hypothetical protein [Nocardioidaceae bacterium]